MNDFTDLALLNEFALLGGMEEAETQEPEPEEISPYDLTDLALLRVFGVLPEEEETVEDPIAEEFKGLAGMTAEELWQIL